MKHNLVFVVFVLFIMTLKAYYRKGKKKPHLVENPPRDHAMQKNKDGQYAK